MPNLLKRIDKVWTALALIAAIFIAGGTAAIDYFDVRSAVIHLEKKEASRTYWRIKKKMDNKSADIYEMAEWCEAASILGYECDMSGAAPSASIFNKAFAGSMSQQYRSFPLSEKELAFLRETSKRYSYWQYINKRGKVRRPFTLSKNINTDRWRKKEYCRIANEVHVSLMSRMPPQYRSPYVCPKPFTERLPTTRKRYLN